LFVFRPIRTFGHMTHHLVPTSHRRRRARLVAGLLGAASLVAACGSTDKSGAPAAAKPTALHLFTGTKTEGPAHDIAAEIDRVSNGALAVTVDVAQHAELGRGADAAVLDDVIAGRAPLGITTLEALEAKGVHTLDPLAAPGIITSVAGAAAVARAPIAATMLAGVSKTGAVGIAIIPGRIHYLMGLQRPVAATADLSGQVAFVTGTSDVAVAAWKAAGATTRLDDRVTPVGSDVRAADASVLDLAGHHLDSQHPHLAANVPLWPESYVLVMNKAAFDGLTAAQRSELTAAGTSAAAPRALEIQQEEDQALATACSSGALDATSLPSGEQSKLMDAMRPVTEAMRADTALAPIVAAVEQASGTVPTPAALACAAPPSVATTVAATATTTSPAAAAPITTSAPTTTLTPLTGTALTLVGTWKANVTHEALLKAGMPAAESGEEGDNTIQFTADGHFTWISGDGGNYPFYSLSVNGDTITIAVGGKNLEAGAGETWSFQWSVFNGTLTLTGKIGSAPTAFYSQPFQKAG
jgi:TRAP-type C4-dicarboxylate transport system substrate-binding protein